MEILDPRIEEEADNYVNLGEETLGTSVLTITVGAWLEEVLARAFRTGLARECADWNHQWHLNNELS